MVVASRRFSAEHIGCNPSGVLSSGTQEVNEMANQLKVTLVKSAIARPEDQKRTLEALGLRKLNKTVVCPDTPAVRGMVAKVQHLVTCEEIDQA